MFSDLTDKQQTIVETYHRLRRELDREPHNTEVATEAYETCHDSYVWGIKNNFPELFEEEPVEVQETLWEDPDENLGTLLANSPEETVRKEELLLEVYDDLRARGYSVGDLAPFREYVLDTTWVESTDLE